MKKLKILHISNTEFWGMGRNKGVSCIYLPLKECIKRGHEVHYVVSTEDYRSRGINHVNYEDINMYWFNIPLYPSKIKIKFLRILLLKLYSLIFIIKGAIITYKIAKKIKPDIIYGDLPRGIVVAYFISRIFKIPNISRFYGTFLYRLLTNPLYYMYLFDEVIAWKLPANYYIITNDGTGGDKVAQKIGISSEKVKFWRNGVEDTFIPNFPKAKFKQKLGIPDNAKVILALSRLERWKRVGRIISAMPSVVKRRKDVMFVIVGEGARREELEELVEKLEVQPYVKFVGAVDREDVKRFLNTADIFVSCYELSNVGNPLLEAMMAGKCIVTLNNGETSSIIKHGKNGFLIEPRDDIIQAKLPKILLELLDNNELRDKIGRAALKYARENFTSWEERIAMEMELLENLPKEKKV